MRYISFSLQLKDGQVIGSAISDSSLCCVMSVLALFREGPLENFWGGGAKYKKNIRAMENSMKKNSCTPINPKKYSCYRLKKLHTGNMITKKYSCGSKIPHPPPITFLTVRPLGDVL